MNPSTRTPFQRYCTLALMALMPVQGLLMPAGAAAQVRLADQPVFASNAVPGNLALTLSVEFPTVSRTAHVADYTSATQFLGYFDPEKCYSYVQNTAAAVTDGNITIPAGKGDQSYFNPVGKATNRVCSGQWSGNFLNWASLTAIDPFRWAMTGGRRVVDTPTQTIIEKGWNHGHGYFPTRDQSVRTEGLIPLNQVAGATPFTGATSFSVEVNGRGYAIRIAVGGAPVTNRLFNVRYFHAARNSTAAQVNFNNATAVATGSNDTAYHDWGNNSPATGVNADQFAVEYTGRDFIAPEAGNYVFRTRADDGVRLWIDTANGTNYTSLIDNWVDQGPTERDSVNVWLERDQRFSLRIRYYDSGGGAVMQLSWRKPSSSSFSQFSADAGTYDYTMRVKVCDPSVNAGGVEANCKQYGSNWKPEGLIQKYSQDIRFSAFGYINETGNQRDGAVMRARQKFVGPTQPQPGLSPIANTAREWSAEDGVMVRNPDAADALSSGTQQGVTVQDSGVMNYLNKFGQIYPGAYKGNDPVNELYYAALRYFRNLGDVAAWSNLNTTDANTQRTRLDGFPVIRDWGDPILYSCQRNFILGIGDIYTHHDKNVPGGQGDSSATMPTFNDTMFDAQRSTGRVQTLQGMSGDVNRNTGSDSSPSYMAGLAFEANAKDIRPDMDGKQTVQTYWVDVLEAPFVSNNKFYLAAKFGGMKLPSDFDLYSFAGTIEPEWWTTTGETVGSQQRPDNYFTAGRPDTMVSGLTRAFESIVGNIKAFTTSFSLAGRQLTSAGNASYATQYDSANWSGELTGSSITIDTGTGTPVLSPIPTWSTATRFETQLGLAANATGWDTNRRIVTWNPDATSGAVGTPFRIDTISAAQKELLNTSYVANDDSANYLNWLRGDPSRESAGYRSRSTTSSAGIKRSRLGDIVNSKVTVVAGPPAPYSETANPGYRVFKETHKDRQTMLYVGANDGMLHAFKGGLSNTDAGTELFAYIPSVLFRRNPADSSSSTDGLLAQLGRPQYAHRNYVDATAKVYDIDFRNAAGAFGTTVNQSGTTNADWRSVLIGGLGKGGRSYYAIDVTDPSVMTSEEVVAGKVLWEFPARSRLPAAAGGDCAATRTDCIDMGYSYGEPIVVKTAKYGWVVIFTSGYNNVGGKGHLFIVNPTNGALLEDISTGATSSSGMARPTAYVRDYTDMTADSVYVGDLGGQLWRFDLSAARGSTGSYPAPTKIAQLTSDGETAQPITSRPLIEIHPVKRKRFVLVGTGRLLHESDISDTQIQTFYAIIDGGIAAFSTHANDNEAWPVTRESLEDVEDPTVGVDTDGKAGWRLQLHVPSEVDPSAPSTPEAPGWRVVGDQADAYNGIIGIASFPTVLPTGDVCSPSGISRAYALNYATGKTVLNNGAAYVGFTSVITDLNFLTVGGKTRLVAGDNKGEIQTVPGNFGDADPRRLSWREIPVGN